jgi:hypothetical protein
MSERPPDRAETPEERFARISKMPGVIVHHNPNPKPWTPPSDIRVINITDINELTGDDWDDEE